MAATKQSKSHTKKRKKIRYRKIEFKISDQQKKLIDRHCRSRKITPVRMIKYAINDYLKKYASDLPEEVVVSKNQLKLFDLGDEENTEFQTSLFTI
jgi:hypothetical protein